MIYELQGRYFEAESIERLRQLVCRDQEFVVEKLGIDRSFPWMNGESYQPLGHTYVAHLARLDVGIRILERTPDDESFDMGSWGTAGDALSPEEIRVGMCGTSACAWGTIASTQWAASLGVKTEWGPDVEGWGLSIEYVDPGYYYTVDPICAEQFVAALMFFGIHRALGEWLFLPVCYGEANISPGHVVQRMRRVQDVNHFLRTYGWVPPVSFGYKWEVDMTRFCDAEPVQRVSLQ